MFEVKVRNLQGIQTHGANFDTEQEAQSWINSVESKPSKPWGIAAQIIQQQVETQPAVIESQEMLDENGLSFDPPQFQDVEISPAQYEMQEVELPGTYTVEIVDKTAQVQQEQANQNAKQFLAESDWKRNRHISQKALNIPTSLSEQEYLEMEQNCQIARDSIIE
jgi:hypothetical protein